MSSPAITFLIRSLESGGAERQLVQLALGLHRLGWQVEVITFYSGGVFENALGRAGVPLICLGKRGRWDFASLLRLARHLRVTRPDVLHGYLPVPNILTTLLRPERRTRVVWGVRASNMDLDRYDWLWKVEAAVARLLSRFADLIICNSTAGLNYHLAQGYPQQKLVVIPNGIDVERFRPDAQARDALRAEWGISPQERLVGLVARIDPMKDHPNFLRAAAQVRDLRREVRFVCVGAGDPEYRRSLERLAASLGLEGRVAWAGLRSDMWRVYSALDVAVSSSVFGEGFSNAVAEAMATGVPCVVTDVGDSAAIVGDSGWACPPGDSVRLARSILRALDALPVDPESLRARVVQHFSVQALVERTAGALVRSMDAAGAVPGQRPCHAPFAGTSRK